MALSQFFKNKYYTLKDSRKLNAIKQFECDTTNLRKNTDSSIQDLFQSDEIENLWNTSKKEIDFFTIPDGSGGVNPGDRRALYYLISRFKPLSVLEVGTHIGASTLHIASALYMSQIKNNVRAHLTTVDIMDVNSTVTKPWLIYGAKYSPADMINKFNYNSFVTFVVDTSLHFAATSKLNFDFIFLDGSHSADVVYQEIPMALKLLNPNGVILLHDYFPKMKPLWSNGIVIPGPLQAVERLVKEGVRFTVLPLKGLPWPTKLSSNITSLALLLKNDDQ